jgi:large subunit ribosomal protein L32e
MRKQLSGVPRIVKIGYRGPKDARGLHPSGYTDNIVYNVNDLYKLDPNKDAARLAHTVGARKRKQIISQAKSMHIKILNPGIITSKKDKEEHNGEKD